MSDPVGFVLLLLVGAFGVALAVFGLRRGKAVAVWDLRRDECPARFWYAVGFQLVLGVVCLGLAVTKLFDAEVGAGLPGCARGISGESQIPGTGAVEGEFLVSGNGDEDVTVTDSLGRSLTIVADRWGRFRIENVQPGWTILAGPEGVPRQEVHVTAGKCVFVALK